MQIKFRIRNVEAVQSFLRAIPRGAVKVALEAFTDYVIGDESHGLRHADPYKFVTRKSAYGFSFFTDKQRRWFFWALRSGKINPGQNNRTGKSTEAWTFTPQEKGKNYSFRLVNDTAGGYWTRSDKYQARQLGKVGWWKVAKVVAKNLPSAIKAARIAVKAYLQKNK